MNRATMFAGPRRPRPSQPVRSPASGSRSGSRLRTMPCSESSGSSGSTAGIAAAGYCLGSAGVQRPGSPAGTRGHGSSSRTPCPRRRTSARRSFPNGCFRTVAATVRYRGRPLLGYRLRIRVVAGLADARLQDLRRSCASPALRRGETVPVIGRLREHSRAGTRFGCTHPADVAVRGAIKAMECGAGERALRREGACRGLRTGAGSAVRPEAGHSRRVGPWMLAAN